MSRIGKRPVEIPKAVNCAVDGKSITFNVGDKKKLYVLPEEVNISILDQKIFLDKSPTCQSGDYSAMIGMARSNIKNIISGLDKGFKVVMEYNGVGYKATVEKNTLILSLGHSHEIFYVIPKDVTATIEKPNLIVLSGSDKMQLGQIASEIISFRKTEPYKGKGIKIFGKSILRKEGKKK